MAVLNYIFFNVMRSGKVLKRQFTGYLTVDTNTNRIYTKYEYVL
jgi:hypothetical protein